MSIYNRYGQGPIEKNNSLTLENIDRYLEFAVDMDAEVSVLNSIANLEIKLKNADATAGSGNDVLYSQEYLQSRITKLKNNLSKNNQATRDKIAEVKTKLAIVNAEISELRPIVFDKELGKNVEHHIRMSELDEQRLALEDDYVQIFRDKYSELCTDLPKIFYMILDGGDINTVKSCFSQMRMVLTGKLSVDKATEQLMNESSKRYNLPAGFWDPLKGDGTSGKSKKLVEMMNSMNTGGAGPGPN